MLSFRPRLTTDNPARRRPSATPSDLSPTPRMSCGRRLTVIQGELEALAANPGVHPDLRDRVGIMLEEVERLGKIVQKLFALSRLDAGEAQEEWVRVDLAALAGATSDQMLLLAEDKSIKLSRDTDTPVFRDGRPGPAEAGCRQPCGQRGQVHTPEGESRAPEGPRERGARTPRGDRHGHRHPARGGSPGVRAILQGQPRRFFLRGGCRPRACPS